ncbi:MAG: glycerophosphodiester phosphodiesterase family protein [Pseudomonadota bacterium]
MKRETPALPRAFFDAPIAHRGLHDRASGVIENSRAAVAAATEAGYGIEIDLQLSADGEAMVFHDDRLDRLTATTGPVRARPARELARLELTGGAEGMPTLADILDLVRGRVPLLIEAKDQSGALGPVDGRLERRAARLLAAYEGPVALMSFNPDSVAAMAEAAPSVARGRVTMDFRAAEWAGVAPDRRAALNGLGDLDALACGFISHHHTTLEGEEAQRVMATGRPVLCWTVRSEAEEASARRHAANVTFEGYRAAIARTEGA